PQAERLLLAESRRCRNLARKHSGCDEIGSYGRTIFPAAAIGLGTSQARTLPAGGRPRSPCALRGPGLQVHRNQPAGSSAAWDNRPPAVLRSPLGRESWRFDELSGGG